MLRLLLLTSALVASPAAARLIQARGQWAAFADDGRCRAMARSLRDAGKGQDQAFAAFLFDPARRQAGTLSVRLSRPVRAGGSVILTVGDRPFMLKGAGAFAWSRGPAQEAAILAAVRGAGGMRIDTRDVTQHKRVERSALWYSVTPLDGRPTRTIPSG